jgi:mRNA interferase MazF
MSSVRPARGDVWLVDFGETVGHEQAGTRPAIVVSIDTYNQGPREMVVVVPTTTRQRVPAHFAVSPPEGGLKKPSYVLWDQICRVSHRRLERRFGAVSEATMQRLEARLRALLGLSGLPPREDRAP